jgi:hypothetical protein
MSSVSNLIELPFHHDYDEHVSLEYDIVLALATADDLASGIFLWSGFAATAAPPGSSGGRLHKERRPPPAGDAASGQRSKDRVPRSSDKKT